MRTNGNLALASGPTVRLFGLDIRRVRPKARGSIGQVVPRPNSAQGPWSPYFSGYIARVVSPQLFEILRESIPVLDAAIDRLVTLDGVPEIEGDNQALVDEIRDWAQSVRCGDTEFGLSAFVRNWRNEIHEQGFGLVEWVYASGGRDIERLNVADSKSIQFARHEDGRLGVYFSPQYKQRYIADAATHGVEQVLSGRASANVQPGVLGLRTELDMRNKRIMAYRSENGGDPYGVSLLRSMEFVSQTLLTIENGLLNSWERFGDPSFHVHYKAGGRVDSEVLESRRKVIAEDFAASIAGKRSGQSADFVTAVDKDSDMAITIIGHDGQVLEIETPARHVLEQIVAKTGLPPWMLGLIWGTSERLAKFQSELLKQESDTRTAMERPHVEAVIAAMLRVRGRTWRPGDWRVVYDKPNLSDEVAKAQARFMNAQADAVLANAGVTEGQSITISTGGDNGTDATPSNVITFRPVAQRHRVAGDHALPSPSRPVALETRPFDNPALDTVESDALSAISDAWNEATLHLIRALGLEPQPSNVMTSDGYEYTTEDEQLIDETLAAFIAAILAYDAMDQGPLTAAYIRAWSQGILDAYVRSGVDAPAAEMTNSAAIEQMLATSREHFDTYMDEHLAPRIRRILQAGAAAGDSPQTIAANLQQEMGGAPWKWEQIARSEIAMAWDSGKRGEWAAEIDAGLIDDQFDFVPAPDGCPQCQAQAVGNPRPLIDTPRPVIDTHPSCRCDVAPHTGE